MVLSSPFVVVSRLCSVVCLRTFSQPLLYVFVLVTRSGNLEGCSPGQFDMAHVYGSMFKIRPSPFHAWGHCGQVFRNRARCVGRDHRQTRSGDISFSARGNIGRGCNFSFMFSPLVVV